MGRSRLSSGVRWGLAAVLAAVAAGAAGAVVLDRTTAGRALALNWMLDRLQPLLDGTIQVGSVGPGGIWGGATLRELVVLDGQGRPVTTVDSVRARYSLRGLLGGAPAIADLRLWSPVVVDEPGPDGRSRLAAVFAPGRGQDNGGGSDDDGVASRPRFAIHGARIHDGALVLRNAAGDERRLEGIEAELESIDLAPQRGKDYAAEIDSLTAVYLLEDARLAVAVAGAVAEGTAKEIVVAAERVRLPSSVAAGRAAARRDENGRWSVVLEVEQARSALADFAWLDFVAKRLEGGLAQGVATGAWRLESGPDGLALDAIDGAVEWDGGRVALAGGVSWAESASGSTAASPRFRELRTVAESVDAGTAARLLSPIAAARLRETEAQVVSGELVVNGAPDSLVVEASLVLLGDPGSDTLAVASGSGTVLGNYRSVRDLALDATFGDYRLARALHPRFPWAGPGRVAIWATGDLPTGMRVRASATRSAAPPPLPSPPLALAVGLRDSVAFAGTLYGTEEVAVVEGEVAAAPLALAGLERLWPGAVRGTVAVSGPLERLRVAAELTTPAGPVAAEGEISLLDPTAGYDLSFFARDLRLSELVPGVPGPAVLSGTASVVGSGASLDSIRGTVAVALGPSTVGPVQVDTLEARARVGEDGLFHVESIVARAGGFDLRSNGGSLGFAPGTASNAQGVVVGVSSPSIRPLQPLFMGENLVVWDELSSIEQGFMIETDGVNPDTFPDARDIRFDGSAEGELLLRGTLGDLTASLSVTARDLAYGPHSFGVLKVDGDARGLRILPLNPTTDAPAPPIALSGTVEAADSVVLGERRFASVRVEGAYSLDGAGRAQVRVHRADGESYQAQASIRVEGDRGRVDLDRLVLQFDDLRWNLQSPAQIVWSPEAVVVHDFGLVRPGGDGLRLHADGRLALRDGASEFVLETTGLDLALVGRLLQLEDPPIGIAQAEVRVGGTAEAPRWDGLARIENAALGALRFDSVSAEGSYAGRTMNVQAGWWTGARETLAVAGDVPLDLRFAAEDRVTDEPIDLEIAADSFPLALVLGAVNGLEEVDGILAGGVRLRGTRTALSPDGKIRIEGGTGLVEALGVRLSSGDVEMTLIPDGKVSVKGSLESGGGTVRVQGVVNASQPLDPAFDLAFWPRGLQVVNRRDMEAAVTGDSVTLTGSYTAPFVEGTLEVDGGTVYLEEFQRSAEMLSFYDRSLFEAATEGAGPDAVAVGRNPFLANLRVLVEMHVGRGNWLRSREMNIETEGDLTVTFDRQRNELILYGAVEVVRGSYTGLPRPFAMTEGEFEFPGTPGFDPNVSVTAESRLRSREGQPIVVTADISGPLNSLRLELASDAGPGVTEGDIYSYLLTGQPQSAGQARVDAGVNLLVGRVANQIGNLLAPQLSLDQLSVSQAELSQAAATIGASSLQVEFGRYVRDNVFLKGVYQRGYCADPTLPVNSGGARVEVEMPRDVTLEGFFENRCTREGLRGLGGLSLDRAWIWGLSFFRDWGY